MPLLPRKSVVALATVVDVALNARGNPVTSRALAGRLSVPPRYLEPILQALGRAGIVKGQRGPRGGYELARERRRISAADVLKAAGTIPEDDDDPTSPLIADIVVPALLEVQTAMLARLADLSLDDLVRRAETEGIGRAPVGDYAI
jgi:Rrf2 family transcriptional regulator, iron-sulfur cluster assembly transcription factor